MQINLNIKKNYLLFLIAAIVLASGIGYVIAYNTSPANPVVMGHTLNEINFSCTRVTGTKAADSIVDCSSLGAEYKLITGGCWFETMASGGANVMSLPTDRKWRCNAGTGGSVTPYAWCCK